MGSWGCKECPKNSVTYHFNLPIQLFQLSGSNLPSLEPLLQLITLITLYLLTKCLFMGNQGQAEESESLRLRSFLCFDECFLTFLCFFSSSTNPYISSCDLNCYHCFQNDDVFSFCSSYDACPQNGYDLYPPSLDDHMFTFVLTTISGIVARFSTMIASLVSKLGFFLPSFASPWIILELNFHFLTKKRCIIKPKYRRIYSLTASAASYPSLYSIKAKEY